MTVQKNNRKQAFWLLVVLFSCVTVTLLCLSACRIEPLNGTNADTDQSSDRLSSAERDAYEIKITYYQAQLQSLSEQLSDMEQQMYLLRENYMNELQALEEKLNQASNPPPVNDPTSSDGNEMQGNETESTDKGQDAPSSVPNPEFAVCNYTYRIENNCAILTSYLGNEKNVVIPAAVDGYVVIGLDDRVFAERDIESVTIPETVERIGWFTFYQCVHLEKVVLPQKLSSIGYASFDGCPSTLCLHVIKDSYAEKFAISFGLRYQEL